MVVLLVSAKIDFNTLQKAYFQWDKPVEYHLSKELALKIFPIYLCDSDIFLASIDVIMIDKDSIPDPQIISMSYLDFLITYVIRGNQINADKFLNILKFCLHQNDMRIIKADGFLYLQSLDGKFKINAKQFNDIRRIILYQNIIGYDDEYVNPELKVAMEESDALKNNGIELPNLERKMAIISSHSGITKKQQMDMSLREHSMLFNEITGEVEHMTNWPVALYAGKTKELDHWIYRKSKGKLDGYVIGRNEFISKMGNNPNDVKQSNVESLDNMYNNFSK